MNWSKLADELQGDLVLPGDPTYDLLRQPFNQRIDRHPAAVARCLSESDVVACVRFAASSEIAVTCRSGGHGAEGYCSIDDALMIDQSAMQRSASTPSARLSTSGPGRSGAGRSGDLPRGLASPGGGCAEVGVGGSRRAAASGRSRAPGD